MTSPVGAAVRVEEQGAVGETTPEDLARTIVPLRFVGSELFLAMADPTDLFVLDDIRAETGLRELRVAVAPADEVRKAIERLYEHELGTLNLLARLGKSVETENLRAGVDDYVTKPVDHETLRMRLDILLRRHSGFKAHASLISPNVKETT